MSVNKQREQRVVPECVYLVGAGPGDPDLLTMKAHRLLREAEVLVYDRLVSDAVLEIVPAGATRISVGKAPNDHSLPQDEINQLLVRLARSGRRVVRLKGGDPFVFGRGGEEAEWLARHDVPFEVVPGITAASGCATALGVPLTHRGVARGARFVTGHCREDVPLELNWESLADPETTLAVYMGLSNIQIFCDRLQEAGLPGDTPVVAVASGTTPKQRVCRTVLKNLPADARAATLKPPVLFIIGRVVSVAEKIGIARLPEVGTVRCGETTPPVNRAPEVAVPREEARSSGG